MAKCRLINVEVNSFLAIVAVSSLEMRFDRNSFSRIFLIDGRLFGSLISMSASKSFKS